MKTDKFDETLRKKIESIQPIFHEDDWQRFTAFAGTQAVPFWKSFWGKATLYSVGTTAFLGLIAYNIIQHYAQKSLYNTIQTLSHQVDSLQRSSNAALAEGPMPDTVYITRYLPSSSPINNPNFTNNEVEPATQITRESTDRNEATSTLTIAAETIQFTHSEPNTLESNPDEGAANFQKNEPLALETPKNNGDILTKKSRAKIEKNRASNSKNDAQILAANIPPPVTNAPALLLKRLAIIGLDSTNKMKVAEPNVPFQTAYYQTPKPPKLPFVWPTLTVRAGAGVSISSGYFSPDLTAELFIGKRTSISTGLKINYFQASRYFTDEQFSKNNKRDFRSTYAPKAPPNMEILNISERSYLVQIPVRLSYYQPLSSGYWLLGSVGTDLDVYGSKRVTFDLRETRSEFQQRINIAKIPVVVFNNLVFSAGIEKRFERFGMQISPYWVTRTNWAFYQKKANNFGGQLKLLYRF